MSRLSFQHEEILETIRMVQMENLDIRTITMGISLRDCAAQDLKACATRAYDKICRLAARLVQVGEEIERDYGVPIINKRISVTPIAMVAESSHADDYTLMAEYLDRAAQEVGVNFLGGFSALVQKGYTRGDRALIASIPEALAVTQRVCASVNVGTTKAGINMDAVAEMGRVIKQAETILQEAWHTLALPDMAGLLGPEALVEVEVTARVPALGGRLLHGTIDRLLVGDARILAVDYKSNAVVPDRPQDVPDGILRQMGAYAAMLEEIYPGRRVETAILWTRTGRLMPLSPEIVREALAATTIP